MLKWEVMAMTAMWRMKEGVKESVHDFFTDEEGDTNLISIILVLVIVMALAVIFRKNIATLVNNMWTSIFKDAGDATKTSGGAATFPG